MRYFSNQATKRLKKQLFNLICISALLLPLQAMAVDRFFFITSGTIDATSTNISDYNNFVNAQAAAGSVTGPLNLTWKAVASTSSITALQNIGGLDDDNPIKYVGSGTPIASGTTELFDFSGAPSVLGSAPNENAVASTDSAWTGFNIPGGNTIGITPLGTSSVTFGNASFTDVGFWALGSDSASESKHLYAISLVVPTPAPVPTIGTLSSMPFGIIVLVSLLYSTAARRRVKRP